MKAFDVPAEYMPIVLARLRSIVVAIAADVDRRNHGKPPFFADSMLDASKRITNERVAVHYIAFPARPTIDAPVLTVGADSQPAGSKS